MTICTPTRVAFCIAFSTNRRLHVVDYYTFAEVYWDEIRRREQQGPFWHVLPENLRVPAMSDKAVQADEKPVEVEVSIELEDCPKEIPRSRVCLTRGRIFPDSRHLSDLGLSRFLSHSSLVPSK